MRPMQRRQRLRLTSAMIALAKAASIVATPKTSFADEGGVSFWLPGLFGSLAAAPQQPGWQFAAINYYTNVSASGTIAAAREVTIGKLNPSVNLSANVNLHAQADLGLLNGTYVFATPVLGGQLAVGMMGIVGTNHVDLDGTITAGVRNFTVTRQGSIGDTTTGVGDLYPVATLRWNNGVNNFMIYTKGQEFLAAWIGLVLQHLARAAIYWPPKLGSACTRVTGGGFHLPVRASDLGA
jgi:hypothetical protein